METAKDWTEVNSLIHELQSTRDSIIASNTQESARREQEHQARLAEFDSLLGGIHDQVRHALLVQKGDPGSPGKDANVDHAELARQVIKLIPMPKNGTDAVVDHKKLAQEVSKHIRMPQDGEPGRAPSLEEIFGYLKENFKLEDFPQVKNEMASYRSQLAGKKYGTDTFVRGGGDSVKAGNNVTITSNPDGTKTINASGGGSLTPITVSGTRDDSNVAFTAPSQPTMLNINGAFYLPTGGTYTWTYLAGAITLNNPVGTSGSIFGV